MPAEVTEAPAAAAPSAAPSTSPSPAPSSAPAASTPAPETSSVAAPESTAAPASGSTATTELSVDDFGSLAEYAEALVKQRAEQKNASAAPVAETVEAVVEQPPADGAPETIVPDGDTPAEVPAPAEPTAEQLEKGPEELEFSEILTAPKLTKAIDSNPELKAILGKDPSLRNELYRNARLAGETAQYREIAPTIKDAIEMRDQAVNYSTIDSAFEMATTPEGVNAFLNKWGQMALMDDGKGGVDLQRDAQGNPIPDGRGGFKPKLHPAFTNIFSQIENDARTRVWASFDKIDPNKQDGEYQAALDIVRERMTPSSRGADDELPEAQRIALNARQAELDRREQEQTRTLQAQKQAETQRFDRAVGEEATSKIQSLIEPALKKLNLAEGIRDVAREKIEESIFATLSKNQRFLVRMAQLERLPMTAETRQVRANVILEHVNAIAGQILREVTTPLLQPVIQQVTTAAAAKAAKVATQTANSRSEVRSSAGPAIVAQKATPEATFEKIKSEFAVKNNRPPEPHEIVNLWAAARRSA